MADVKTETPVANNSATSNQTNHSNNNPTPNPQRNNQNKQIKKKKGGGNAGQHNNHQNHHQSNDQSNWRQSNVLNGHPTFELPAKNTDQKKFTGRCRLFVANLPQNVTEEQMKSLFGKYGEISEVFLGKQNSFAFVKMDTRSNAEAARAALDFKNYEGRTLRVRLAAHAAAIRVKNLSPFVTNELLEHAFSYFGDVERAVVISDDRGRSIGEGIIEFARKISAQNALKRTTNECLLLTSIPRPVVVEPFEQKDEEEGFPEKSLNKSQPDFRQEREIGPRFAEAGSFEHEFAMRWKQLFELEKQKRDRLEQEIQDARKQLQEQMEYARIEHHTKVLREQVRQMEEKAGKIAQLRDQRLNEDRQREEQRRQQEIMIRQQEEDLLRRQQAQDFNVLRRQENELRMQANALQDLLDREQALRQMGGNVGGEVFPNQINEVNPAIVQQPQQNAPPFPHLQALQRNMPMMGNQMNAPPQMDLPRFGSNPNMPNMPNIPGGQFGQPNPGMNGPQGPPPPNNNIRPNRPFNRPNFNGPQNNKRRRY